jgi:hypothetical protein
MNTNTNGHTEFMEQLHEKADRLLLAQMQHGKSRVARVFDRIVCTICGFVIFYVLAFVFTRDNIISVILSALLTALCFCSVRLITRARQRQYLQRRRRQVSRELQALLLCTATKERFYHWMREALARMDLQLCPDCRHVKKHDAIIPVTFLRLAPDEKPQKRDLLQLPAYQGILVVTVPCPSTWQQFATQLGFSRVIDSDAAGFSRFIRPDEEEVSAYIIQLYAPAQSRRTYRPGSFLAVGRAKGYLISAAFLLGTSLFTFYPLYYRIGAAVCIALAVGCFAFSAPAKSAS